MIHPKIIHHGFLQPHELTSHLIDAAAFVMPSKKEPWGVVLHEMAIAGLPLGSERMVGSRHEFIFPSKWQFDETIAEEVKVLLKKSTQQLAHYSAKSHQLGTRHPLFPGALKHHIEYMKILYYSPHPHLHIEDQTGYGIIYARDDWCV